jgi:hypothetical protein
VINVADYMKFSLRLDYDNPDHDKIITALDNLDKKRHKTKTQFIINALTHYIDYLNLADGEELIKERMSNLEGFLVTRKEFENQIAIIRAELKAELYKDMVSMAGVVGSVKPGDTEDSDGEFNVQEESCLDNDLSKYAGIMDSVMSWSEE